MDEKIIDRLIGAFMFLPGVGFKTAQRYAYKVLSEDFENVKNLADCMIYAKQNVRFCNICGNFSTKEICDDCLNNSSKILCVVESPQDIAYIDKSKNFDCAYHVLHGCISPLKNKGPDDIRLKELLNRVNSNQFNEVIVATNPDVEGEATAMYISKLLKPLNIKVTRIAQGIAMGSELEYTDEVTLSKALEARKEI